MSKRKKREGEYTCRCTAYKFPHRFGGGKCTGYVIAKDTWELTYGSGICSTCNCLDESEDSKQCDVINGSEDVSECEAFQEFIHFNDIKYTS